ncbi:MAG: PAS domain-containing protein, partial [Gemmatimonadota bacterium]|nr:PAS domain-containing protein [Gemmatimonadota bacterium]
MRIANRVAAFFWPLERQLPLLIAALLCAVVGAFGWLAHEALERAFEAAAAERLVVAAHRMSALVVESVSSVRSEGEAFARQPALAALLSQPGESASQRTDSLFNAVQPSGTRASSRAVWTAQCVRVASSGSLSASVPLTTCPSAGAPTHVHEYGIQPLAAWGDSVMYVVILPVVRAADTLGYYVQARVVGSGASARVLAELLGGEARLLLGNATGPPLWSDLTRRVSGPSGSPERGVVARYQSGNNGDVLAVMLDVPSTPWVALVQLPAAIAMGGLDDLLRSLAAMALLCVAVGVFCAWLLSRHVTGPIAELTRAEEDFADGNYSRRVVTARRDELGELLTSFNRMAERVERSSREVGTHRHLLEAQVKESQDLAHELAISNADLQDAITQMKTANRERKSAQSLLDEVLTEAPVGIAVFDGQMRFVRVNAALASMNGHSVEAHVGQLVRAMMPPMTPTAESHLERVLATGHARTNQVSSSTVESGSRRHWMGSYFAVCGPAGEVTGAGAILVDTTAHVELEAELLHAQKM